MSTETAISRTTVIDLVKRYLHSPESSWSNGISGAIGEFMYDEDETVSFGETADSLSALTGRGAMSIKLPGQLTCFAYEQLTHCTRSWAQTIALSLPRAQAGLKVNRVITDLGEDREAVRARDRGARLFDLGLGSDQMRFCVRTKEGQLAEKLTSFCGLALLDEGQAVMTLLQGSSPDRIVISALGRIEVYTPIPGHGVSAEMGPHTHLLPRLLGKDESVVPVDYSASMHVYPPHPLHDKYGADKPFDPFRYNAFQDVLEQAGIKDYLEEKQAAGDPAQVATGSSSKWYHIARRIVKMQSDYLPG